MTNINHLVILFIILTTLICSSNDKYSKQLEEATVPIQIKNKMSIKGKLTMGESPKDTISTFDITSATGQANTIGYSNSPALGTPYGTMNPTTLNGETLGIVSTLYNPQGLNNTRFYVLVDNATLTYDFFKSIDFGSGAGILDTNDSVFDPDNGMWYWDIPGDIGYVTESAYTASVVWSEIPQSVPAPGEIKITPDVPLDYSEFGSSVSISSDGTTAAISDIGDSNGMSSVRVFTRSGNTWTEQQQFQGSSPEEYDYFGSKLSISGDGNTLVVGSPSSSSTGEVYVFTRSGNTWTEQQKFQSSDSEISEDFGGAVEVSLDGNTIIVGSPYNDTTFSNSGATYIYTRTPGDLGPAAWTEQQKITASNPQQSNQFGSAVSISADGNTAIVGSPGGDQSYVFARSGNVWTERQIIQPVGIVIGDRFGNSASISSNGNEVVIGAYYTSDRQGAAYIFTRTPEDIGPAAWTEQQKIVEDEPESDGNFSLSVSMSFDGSSAVISRPYSGTGSAEGIVCVYTESGGVWTKSNTLSAYDDTYGNSFGYSVAISDNGNTTIAGASRNGSMDQGAAYTYDL